MHSKTNFVCKIIMYKKGYIYLNPHIHLWLMTLYFPPYSSLAQPLKPILDKIHSCSHTLHFCEQRYHIQVSLHCKHLWFISIKSPPSAATKVFILFLKGIQLFAARVAIPHKHATKPHTDSAQISLFSSCPEALHKCHFDTSWQGAAHTFGHSEFFVLASWHTCIMMLSTAEMCWQTRFPNQQDTTPWIQHRCSVTQNH